MGKIRKRVLNLILSIFWAIVYFAYLLIFILVVFANFGYNDATIAIFSIMSTIIFVFVVLFFIANNIEGKSDLKIEFGFQIR